MRRKAKNLTRNSVDLSMRKRAGNETLPQASGISYGSAGVAPGMLKALAILIAQIVQRAAIKRKNQKKIKGSVNMYESSGYQLFRTATGIN